MAVCSKCGRENESRYRFCLGCGAKIDKSDLSKELKPKETPINDSPQPSVESKHIDAELPIIEDISVETAQEDVPEAEPETHAKNSSAKREEGVIAIELDAWDEDLREDHDTVYDERADASAVGAEKESETEEKAPRMPVLSAKTETNFAKGKEIAEKFDRICPQCGSVVADNFKFCGQCGARYDEAVPKSIQASIRREESVEATYHPSLEIERVSFVPARRRSRSRYAFYKTLHEGAFDGVLPLKDGDNLVGSQSVDFLRDDPYISDKHLLIGCSDDGVTIEDMGSLNGVYLQIKDSSVLLEDGDFFRIGEQILRFEAGNSGTVLIRNTKSEDLVVMGGEEAEGWGYLSVILGPYAEGDVFRLSKNEVVLGRQRGDILFPDDGFISGSHASLTLTENGAMLTDLNSSNGTFLRLRRSVRLEENDAIIIGNQLMTLRKI